MRPTPCSPPARSPLSPSSPPPGRPAGSPTALAFVRATRPGGPRGAPSLRAIRDGLSFVRRRPVVLGCMVLDMFAVIFGGAAALLPIYAQEILRVRPRGYGLLSS